MLKLQPQIVVLPKTTLPNVVGDNLTSSDATLSLATSALVVVDYEAGSPLGQLLFYVEETSDGGVSYVALTTARPLALSPLVPGFAFDVRRALWVSEPGLAVAQLVVNLAEVTSVPSLRKIRVQLRDIGDAASPGSVGVTILSAQ